MRRLIGRILGIGALILVCSTLLFASTWEGSATIGNYGDFPESGNYAACNSFARNTLVEVVNLENSQKTTVIVTRNLDTPGVFMKLSADAARALGIRSGALVRVRANLPASAVQSSAPASSRSADPDFNPRQLAEAELQRLGYLFPEPVATVDVAVTTPAVSPTTPAVSPTTPVTTTPVTTPVTTPEPAITPPVAIAPVERPEVSSVLTPGPAAAARAAVRVQTPDPLSPAVVARPTTTPSTPVSPVLTPVTPPISLASAGTAEGSGKPRPVRTLIITALPEPSAPAVAPATVQTTPVTTPLPAPVTAPPIPETLPPTVVTAPETPETPEVLVRSLPTPDEQALVLAPERQPRRFEAPAITPEIFENPNRRAVEAAVQAALANPVMQARQGAIAYDRGLTAQPGQVNPGLVDPAPQSVGSSDSRLAATPGQIPGVSLADPNLQAREGATAYERGLSAASGQVPSGIRLTDPVMQNREAALAIERGLRSPQDATAADLVDPIEQLAEAYLRSGRANTSVPTISLDEPAEQVAATYARLAQARSQQLALALAEPLDPTFERAEAFERGPGMAELLPGMDLAEPAVYAPSLADMSGLRPPVAGSDGLASLMLDQPELRPEELPTLYLSRLEQPVPAMPAVDLVDGIIEEEEAPTAIGRETPYFEALETRVELADAAARPEERPEVATLPGLSGQETPARASLADAQMQTAPVAIAPLIIAPQPAQTTPQTTAPVTTAPLTTPPVVSLQPTNPQPPVTTAPTRPLVTAPPVSTVPTSVTAVNAQTLLPGRFYIQLASYGTEVAARSAAAGLMQNYVYIIEPIMVRGNAMYRLYAGPFNRDESGLVLMQFRSSGFRDAFVKQGS
ncbi:MAG: hypothetical protein A2087_14785 [Spirochaetes bacterium GWD1_61_31]|nr:MAG: hypothetical protein A2Y37_12870 [Spirochaetes bacterium GWB1_60_80]OHD38903.1 MAG: hypothetical protein A2087_14785 [Spirochaetes bacterium GWD1_61_31]OHD43318.1 MAG: hypothetical protein A2Y35_08565 [Spirochaetes bacterium GWE1_60_18]OHD58856.1 MAG: hypothetical protein A2Y32_08935 [Spirochaetes bacterium GWF1_60_12]HAP42510.1 hypothetical protein [Spirochaetaceae bacterium]